MKLRFFEAVEHPITTVAEYLEVRLSYEALLEKYRRRSGPWNAAAEQLEREERWAYFDMRRRLPYVLVSRCPYCATPIWREAGIFFHLRDEAWYLKADNGRDVHQTSLCPHLFCVDGALNLNGHQPSEATGSSNPGKRIILAAEVPFVKPRVLNLPTMVAVVHSLPVADRYTAYTVTYFCTQHPPQREFCISWARSEYFDRDQELSGGTYTGRRSDVQEYDLRPWIERGRLYWLGPDEEDCPVVRGSVADSPYHDVPGRRHPYFINNGKIRDRPDPKGGRPRIKTEFF